MPIQQNKLAHDVLRQFARFISGDVNLSAFERWIYHTPDIADVIGYDDYVQLLSFEYRLPTSFAELQRLVTRFAEQYFPGELFREQVRLVLCDLVTGALPVLDACDQLAQWRHAGAKWIPIVFVGIGSELDHVPQPAHYQHWNPAALAAKLAEVEPLVAHYGALAQAEAQKLLAVEFPDRPCL